MLLRCCVVVVVGVVVVSGNVWLGSLVEGELFTNKGKKERPRALFCSVSVTPPSLNLVSPGSYLGRTCFLY